jgi:MFS family permease
VFERGGVRAVAAYLVAVALPGSVVRRFRAGAIVAPLALVLLALSSETIKLWQIIALGAAIGLGSAWAGRPVAWTTGIHGTPGMMGVAGAISGMILVASGAVSQGLLIAAGLMVGGLALGESHETRTSRPGVLQPATIALAFVVGIRILETGLFQRPAAAGLFATAWAVGMEAGWRAAPRADARLILGAPFVVAGALAGVGVAQGPAMLFLYGGAGFGVGLVGGAGLPQEDRAQPPRWTRYLLAAIAGALWAASSTDFSTTVWVASAVALGGGFVSSQIARRVPVPAPAAEGVLEAPEVLVAERDPLEEALDELADAIARARMIRRDAIAALPTAISSDLAPGERFTSQGLEEIKAQIRDALDVLSQDLSRAAARLQRAAA